MQLKPQLSPHKHCEIVYGAKVQKATEEDTSTPLNADGVKHVKAIVGGLLYYARVVDNKLLYNKIKYLTVLSSIYMKTWKYTAQYPRHIV